MKIFIKVPALLERETKIALKETLYGLNFLLLFPSLIAVENSALPMGIGLCEALFLSVECTVLWICLRYVHTFFRREREDEALEYLLTLPISRKRVFAMKLLPRLTGLVIMIAVFETLLLVFRTHLPEEDSLLFNPLFIPVILVFILFAGIPFSLFFAMKFGGASWVVAMITFFLLQKGSALLLKETILRREEIWLPSASAAFSGIIIIPILLIAFKSFYSEFDLKPLKFHVKRFNRIVLPAMSVVAALAAYIIIKK